MFGLFFYDCDNYHELVCVSAKKETLVDFHGEMKKNVYPLLEGGYHDDALALEESHYTILPVDVI